MRIISKLRVPALALGIALAGCENGLTAINENPNEPEEVPAENLLANAIILGVGGDFGTNGVWSGVFLSNLWAQHLAEPVYNEEDRYSPRSSQASGIWDVVYTGPLPDLKAVAGLAAEAGDENLLATSQILSQYLFLYLTDVFGDIPYTEALQAPAITRPSYDPQEEVYDSILSKLTAAVDAIDQSERSADFGVGDLVYEGDMLKWYRLGNSLRMRAAMRMVNADPEQARIEFVAAYSAGGMQSNADNAQVVWSSSVPNQNPQYNLFVNQSRRDQIMAASLIDRLNAWNDPRVEIYATAAESDGAYRGLPNGRKPGELGLDESDFSQLGEYFLRPTTPSIMMSYSEVLFLQAEAAQRGWISADAETLYRAAVRASMEQFEIPMGTISAYLLQPAVAYTGLNSIWEQKWASLYLVGIEAWTHVRRTGVPALTPALPGATIPGRLFYPDQENLYNPENYRATTLFEKMWWME